MKIFEVLDSPKTQKVLIRSLSFFFGTLCLIHYFSQRPLWLDETLVLKNIQNLSFAQIFGKLLSTQAFPRVHLFIIKFFSDLTGHHLLVLRAISLLAMLCSFLVWKEIYRNAFKENWHFILALLGFAVSYRLIYFASELKPYSMDVLSVGIFAWYVIRQRKFETQIPDKKDYLLALALPLMVFFSYATSFVLLLPIVNFVSIVRKNKRAALLMSGYIAASLAACFVFYHIDLKYSKTVNDFYNGWASYFLCSDSVGCFFETFFEGVQRLATYWYGNNKYFKGAASPFILLFLYSVVRYGYMELIKEKLRIFSLGAVCAVLFSELFILGILKQYPFTGDRITLFFAPIAIYLIVRGMIDLKRVKYFYYFFNSYFVGYMMVCGANSIISYINLYFK